MMGVISRLLNKTVTLKTPLTTNNKGDFGGTPTILGTFKARITTAKSHDTTPFQVQGHVISASHLIFANLSGDDNLSALIPSVGQVIEDGPRQYTVVFNDFEPGGEIDHHQEIYCNMVA